MSGFSEAFPTFCGSFTGAFLPGLFDPGGEFLDEVVDAPVFLDELRDLGGRVDDRCVVTPPELLADLRQRAVGEFAAEIHRDLARVDDRLGATVAGELLERDAKAIDHRLLDPLYRDLRNLTLREDVLQDLLGELDVHGAA